MITKLTLTDFDIFAKNIGNYYNLKEKISSYFSMTLTFVYIIFSLILLSIYLSRVIKRLDYRVYETTYFEDNIPEIKINNNLLYFAFGVEDPKTTNSIVDESIYNIKVEYFDKIKKNDTWVSIDRKNLSISKCNEENFGLGYKKFFKNKYLNDSYCIDDMNLTLAGSFAYERLSYIRMKVYPCVNKTENNFYCKSQEEIDYFLSNGYFSILTKDIGFNPSDYKNPTTPVLRDLYFSIGKFFITQYILYFDITEIQTDKGLFFNIINTEKFLKFNKDIQNINIRNQSDYYNGNHIAEIFIRLSDNIRIQKRNYVKITDILSTIGGYMQLMNIIFKLITLLPNNLNNQRIIVDSLFNFDLKNKKIIIILKYKNRLNYYPEIKYIVNNNINKAILYKNKFRNRFSAPNSSKMINLSNNMQSIIFRNDMNRISEEHSNINEIINKSNLIINKKNDNIIYEKNSNKIDDNSKDILYPGLIQNISKNNSQNIFKSKKKVTQSRLMSNSKDIINPTSIKIPFENNNNNKKMNSNLSLILKSQNNGEKIIKYVKFNLFEYLFFQKCSKNNLNITLFNEASSFYKNQMDVINRFSLILLLKKTIKKENNYIFNNMSCEKIEFKLPSLLESKYPNAK